MSTRSLPYFQGSRELQRSFWEAGESFRLCPPQTGSKAAFNDAHVAGRRGALASPNLAGNQSRDQSIFGAAKEPREEGSRRF